MKASVLFGAGWENDSVEVLWRDAGRVFCRLCQHNAKGEKHAFVPIPAAAEHPTPESVNRLAHEHELRSHLDSTWALRPLELGARARADDARSRLHRWRAARSPRPAADGGRTIPPHRGELCLAQSVSYTDEG